MPSQHSAQSYYPAPVSRCGKAIKAADIADSASEVDCKECLASLAAANDRAAARARRAR